jgi:hypothetical protein
MKVEILKKDSGALHVTRRRKTKVTAEDAKLGKSLTLHQCQVLLANNYYRHRCPVFIKTEDGPIKKPGKLRAGRVALNMKIKGIIEDATLFLLHCTMLNSDKKSSMTSWQ